MKKFQLFFAAAALLFATSAFANGKPEKVSQKVKAAFDQNFTSAKNVTWEKADDFYFAYFELNTKDVAAAYNEKGELVGTSRVISTDQLPLTVSMAIAEKYQGYAVAKVATEITYDGQTSYYVNVENSKQILKLKCGADTTIGVDTKTKK